ncbi:HEAT repeat domain-containing protein [Anaeromyxobacter oryzisoli]|uniref:hypothetical protein n=1 Tax=Anaeromyxobacter oryzisoli TaxID=2925408 RepID=UPI001F59EF4B|nr:hypothetical protein [Anaeromyxobacter sp. SG63]
MSRYDDPSYAQLGLPPDWLAVRLTRSEFDDIIDVLADVLDAYPTLASTAAWALGKSFSDRATPRLISALERYWSSEDHVAHQLLIALENHGLERAESLVEQIAQTGLDESRELAIRLKAKIQRRRAIRSEGE